MHGLYLKKAYLRVYIYTYDSLQTFYPFRYVHMEPQGNPYRRFGKPPIQSAEKQASALSGGPPAPVILLDKGAEKEQWPLTTELLARTDRITSGTYVDSAGRRGVSLTDSHCSASPTGKYPPMVIT